MLRSWRAIPIVIAAVFALLGLWLMVAPPSPSPSADRRPPPAAEPELAEPEPEPEPATFAQRPVATAPPDAGTAAGGCRLRGRVVEVSGGKAERGPPPEDAPPVVGVQVKARGMGVGDLQGTTDDDGLFDLGPTERRNIRVSLRADGYGAAQSFVSCTFASEPIPRLGIGKADARITGRVIDDQGVPVSGSQVRVGLISADVADDGTFSVAVTAPDGRPVRVRAVAPGYAMAEREVEPSEDGAAEVELMLRPEVVITGVVLIDGAPVERAEVTVLDRVGRRQNDYAKDDGKFRVTAPPDDELALFAHVPARSAPGEQDHVALHGPIAFAPGESVEVELRAVPARTVGGDVEVSGEGAPPYVGLRLLWHGLPLPRIQTLTLADRTTWAVTAVPQEALVLVVTDETNREMKRIDIPAGGDVDDVTLTLP